MRTLLIVTVVFFPSLAFAQLAPQSQADFEQRFTGWTLHSDAPECNEGDGVDPLTFVEPGKVDTNGFDGDYEYTVNGANTGTLTVAFDILPIRQVLVLTFNSRTMGTFTAAVSGMVECEGSFEFVDANQPTPEDTTPPSLVSAVVVKSGGEILLTFDENIDFSGGAMSVTADGEPVRYWLTSRRAAMLYLSSLDPVILPGQSVVVSYTDPTPGDDERALQDAAGNDAASFTVTATNNSARTETTAPSLVSVVVDPSGDAITFTFDEDVYFGDGRPVNVSALDSLFSVTADSEPVRLRGYETFDDDRFALIDLSPVITRGQRVVVSYTDHPGDQYFAIQDLVGNDAASFTEDAINNSTVGSVPALPLAAVGLFGLLLASLGSCLRRRVGS
ncbi:MAG: SwmB domain-containing protein [Acidobacteria bacterium]|nr:SwmB domain-containing protein [Acidobacteriota bacterium]